MDEKISYLEAVREDIGEKAFKFSLAKIVVNNYIEVMKSRNMKLSRSLVLSKVNLILTTHGSEKVSYGYLRNVGY
ncbi:hypothetical protein [Peribacillus frigoritolerans]|uniref:hypothetical protein n=1 Tax=Peribacillus frigoritolerans TaxID=450367 RepID=UPI00105A2BE0|nr:hypothetical protein [Peribacillus frigoritolerans]TDL80964.1 hypothetical protein E2R53_13400 [Peribacillus frigoritolerans]